MIRGNRLMNLKCVHAGSYDVLNLIMLLAYTAISQRETGHNRIPLVPTARTCLVTLSYECGTLIEACMDLYISQIGYLRESDSPIYEGLH